MNHWREVVEDQIQKLSVFPKIIVGVLGDEPLELPDNFEIAYRSPNFNQFEYPTLNLLWQHCQSQPGFSMYLHTKGVSHSPENWKKIGGWWESLGVQDQHRFQRNLKEWRNYMEYGVITRRADCLKAMKNGAEVCGSSYQSFLPHFQGNFWWARNQYVKSLESPEEFQTKKGSPKAPRAAAEFWICSQAKYIYTIHHSRHNFYVWGINPKSYLKIY